MPSSGQSSKPSASSSQRYKFLNSEDIRKRFKTQNEDGLIEAFTALRNQLTVKHDEGAISATDERLILLKSWLESTPGAQEIFDIWERVNTRQLALLTLILSVLSTVLRLISNHYTYHSLATPIVKTLLTPSWSSKLNTYLSASHNELLLATLKLYNALSSFSEGRERGVILEIFPWDSKSLPKLLHMRRKKKGDDTVDILVKPDIRTLYVLFLLSFVDSTTTSSVKIMFLEQRRDVFCAIFKGLNQDSYSVVRRVLETCWMGVWSDVKIKRTLKLGLCSESTVGQILRLYNRSTPEGPTSEDITADVAHHFLLAICTRPGTGICFKDRGWYPREDADAEVQPYSAATIPSRPGGRIYNKILSNVVKVLKVNEDPRQQELAYRILQACPELVAGYWPAAALTLEPRLSSRWIANIAFFGSIVSLPVPQATFLLPGSDLYQPSPPPLPTIVENILPSVNIRIHLSRGLQSNSSLVQHCTAIGLAKCLVKYGAVLQAMHAAESALEEDEEGQWTRRRQELKREVMRRVPEFQVVIAFAQQTASDMHAASDDSTSCCVRAALLAESSQRLLWLYHQWLPGLVAEARFDVGKLLHGIQDGGSDATSGVDGLVKMRQLHVLRLLQESEQFSLAGKTGSSRGILSTLLKLSVSSRERALRSTLHALLKHTLSTTALFQHDSDELDLWLSALPFTERAVGAEAPDGEPLMPEDEAVVSFLDDCAQRCLKTPYRYLENLQKAWVSNTIDDDATNFSDAAETFPSPMLMTVLEQMEAKVGASLMAPSDVLSILTFIRKLLWNLAQKVQSIQPLASAAKSVESVLPSVATFSRSIRAAVEREIQLLFIGLHQFVDPCKPVVHGSNPAVEEFLTQVEAMPIPTMPKDRRGAATELVDWLRLADQPLHVSQFRRLVGAVSRLDTAQRSLLFDYLSPSECLLWGYLTDVKNWSDDRRSVPYSLMFLHSNDTLLADEESRAMLAESLFEIGGGLSMNVKRLLNLINLRLVSSTLHTTGRCSLLRLLCSVADRLRRISVPDRDNLLLSILWLGGVQRVARDSLNWETRDALRALLEAISSARGAECIHQLSTLANPWVAILTEDLASLTPDQTSTASMWIQFADPSGLVSLLEHLHHSRLPDLTTEVLNSILVNLDHNVECSDPSSLVKTLPRLISLRTLMPVSPILEKLIHVALNGTIPALKDGWLHRSYRTRTVAEVLQQTRLQPWDSEICTIDISSFLNQSEWTDYTPTIIAQLLYALPDARQPVARWLRAGNFKAYPLNSLAIITHAFLDRSHPTSWSEDDLSYLPDIFSMFAQELLEDSLSPDEALCYVSCIALLPNVPCSASHSVIIAIYDRYRTRRRSFNQHLLAISRHLCMHTPSFSCGLMELLVDSGIEWASTLLLHDKLTPVDTEMLFDLASILKSVTELKTYLVEPLLTNIIQYHLDCMAAVMLASEVVAHTKLKPIAVNRCIQTIIQHPKLYVLCAATSGCGKDVILALLSRFFNMHPMNTCQSSHVEPLLSLYTGTLSISDRTLLSIFGLFERTKKVSMASLLIRWSPSPGITCDSALKVLQNLDPTIVWRTCLHFPQWAPSTRKGCHNDGDLYDPFFLTLLCSQMVVEDPPISATAWIQLLRTNIVSLLIRCLSSHRDNIVEMALAQLAALYRKIQVEDLHEKHHVLYILDLLKDLYHEGNSVDPCPQRVPAYTTLHLAYAFRGVFYPSHFTYPLTARFLLQRPELDVGDVPVLYTTLYSISDQWRRERTWMVRFLTDGMVGKLEWGVLRRRHTWDLVASVFSSEEKDHGLRRGILEFLANVTCNKHATTSLILGSALLSWIEMQLMSMHDGEGLAWAKILENILIGVDFSKIEGSTSGEWRSTVAKCLTNILNSRTCSQGILVQVMQAFSRLCRLPTSHVVHGKDFVEEGMRHLEGIENGLQLDSSISWGRRDADEMSTSLLPPHTSRHLWDAKELDLWRVWSSCVGTLWTVTMLSEKCLPEWYTLTQRMLLWRAVAGNEATLPEWVRRNVMNIGT